MNVLSLFDGISCGLQALKEAGIKVDNYYASEIEKYPIKISKNRHPEIIHLGDVCKIDTSILPKIDLLIGGSPCQDFSAQNLKGLGLKGEKSGLFYEYVRIKNELNPKYFLLENVRMKKEWQDIISKELGAKPIFINSDRFVQQNRLRLYWTNIPIAELPERPNWTGEYYQKTGFNGKVELIQNKSGVCYCLTTVCDRNFYKGPIKRKLYISEVEQLQGLPIDYTIGVPKTHRFKAVGNGWTIPVISHIFKGLEV